MGPTTQAKSDLQQQRQQEGDRADADAKDEAADDAGGEFGVRPRGHARAARTGHRRQPRDRGRRAGARAVLSIQTESAPAEVLAVDARQAASVTLLRPDQSRIPAAALFGAIEPREIPGALLPGHPASVTLIATLHPASGGLAPAPVSVTVMDASGDAYQLAAGTLPLTADRTGSPRSSAGPGGPATRCG